MDLEARWQADVADAYPDVVSILVEPFLLPIRGVVQAGVRTACTRRRPATPRSRRRGCAWSRDPAFEPPSSSPVTAP
ncbi:hypothetical protein ACWDRB_49800 [Nonomuraea sp. NPDC003707]